MRKRRVEGTLRPSPSLAQPATGSNQMKTPSNDCRLDWAVHPPAVITSPLIEVSALHGVAAIREDSKPPGRWPGWQGRRITLARITG